MPAIISDSLLGEYIEDCRFLSVSTLYRQTVVDGTSNAFLRQIMKALKKVSPDVVALWKDFIEVTVPYMDNDAKEYVEWKKNFGKKAEKSKPSGKRSKRL